MPTRKTRSKYFIPSGAITYFTDGGSEGIFGSEILAKRDFGSMKDASIFCGRERNAGIFFRYCTFHQLKSAITQTQFTVGVGFFGYAKNVRVNFY